MFGRNQLILSKLHKLHVNSQQQDWFINSDIIKFSTTLLDALDDRVQLPGWVRDLSLHLCVKTSYVVHTVSNAIVNGGCSHNVQLLGCEANHSPAVSVEL
jgi:hypothetical protein